MSLHGIDLSHWNAGIDIADADADFVVVKATDGTNFFDPEAVNFYRQAKAAGKLIGAYHFYEGDAAGEADYFVAHVREVVGEVLLVLDFETHTSDVAGAKKWLDRVYDKTGVRPLIYMSQSVATSHDWSSVASHYQLWVARYGSSYGDTGAWDEPVMWQYTDAYHTAGHDVDGDWFYGTHADWVDLAAGHTGGGGGSEDDVPSYVNKQNETDVELAADGEWHLLKIDDSGSSDYNLLTGPVKFTGVATLVVEAPNDNTEINVRVIAADVKDGEPTKVVTTWPTHEYRTNGGQTQIQFPFSNYVRAADGSGWKRRVRFQVKAWGGGSVKILTGGARALYWEL